MRIFRPKVTYFESRSLTGPLIPNNFTGRLNLRDVLIKCLEGRSSHRGHHNRLRGSRSNCIRVRR